MLLKKYLTMKSICVIGLISIALSSYGQKTKQYAGTYSYGHSIKRNFGTILIYPETDSTILFFINVNRGAPSYNYGTLYARLQIKDGKGTFYTNTFSENGCKLNFRFIKNNLIIETVDAQFDCGFGNGVFADGRFIKESSKIPYYFEDDIEKIYFKKTKPEDYYK